MERLWTFAQRGRRGAQRIEWVNAFLRVGKVLEGLDDLTYRNLRLRFISASSSQLAVFPAWTPGAGETPQPGQLVPNVLS